MKHALLLGLAALALMACSRQAPALDQDQPVDALVPPTSASAYTASQLDQVLTDDWRPAADRARDRYRHPKDTLAFFGLQPDQTVIEITPGGGWYSRILAPLLRDDGRYIAAVQARGSGEEAGDGGLRARFAADPAHYGPAAVRVFDPKAPVLGPAGSADQVLTFRNAHNWVQAGTAPAMFKAFFRVLKPGGVLGLVDHRASPGSLLGDDIRDGYLPTDYVVKLARDAGFELEASSEINANRADDHDHPKGVWTLPPTLSLGEQDKARYLAIGESDRMTLRFVKPSLPATAGSAATAASAR